MSEVTEAAAAAAASGEDTLCLVPNTTHGLCPLCHMPHNNLNRDVCETFPEGQLLRYGNAWYERVFDNGQPSLVWVREVEGATHH